MVISLALLGVLMILSTGVIYVVLRDIGDQLRKIADAQGKD